MESLLIFLCKKEKRRLNTKCMIEIVHYHWLNKEKYNFGKSNLTRLWVLVTIYPKIKKKKKKTRHRSTYPKELSSEARLRNGNVLGTNSAQIEFGLLDSNDQYNIFAWCEWYVEHTWYTWPKLTHINLSYECIFFFR